MSLDDKETSWGPICCRSICPMELADPGVASAPSSALLLPLARLDRPSSSSTHGDSVRSGGVREEGRLRSLLVEGARRSRRTSRPMERRVGELGGRFSAWAG